MTKSPRRGNSRARADQVEAARPAPRAMRRDEFALHPLFGRRPPTQRRDESLGDFAYRVMREAVRSGKIKLGEHLREADVAGWLAISRTPVREAFHRIVSEGLLVSGPWNGVMLAELGIEQLEQLYAVRAALESTAAGLAAEHATKAEIDLLFEIAAREAREAENLERLVAINAELHQTIYKAARNPYLLQSLTAVVDALGLVRHSAFVMPESRLMAHRDHGRIIKAIRDRKRREAERSARDHVRNALDLRLRVLRSRGY
jgi:DNA-binding GntR family transcriptional regulator